MKYIDMRSDTVTQPTEAMRRAMANAAVGDDVYGEDPSINYLQELAAEMMGKEAGLFVASGTMGNLVAILAHCQRGDEVIMGNKSHTFLSEAGGISVLGGIHSCQLPNQPDGTLCLEELHAAIREDDVHNPITRLVCLENTHNRCGGVAVGLEYTRSVGEIVRQYRLSLHIDGARIFNAAAALGVPAKDLVEVADSVTFCLSKGLSAPVGSVLCGSRDFIRRAHRQRKLLGGGMRQAGVLAAAGIVALETMVERIGEDHRRANDLAKGLSPIPNLRLELGTPHTNMLFVSLAQHAPMSTEQVVELLADRGVLIDIAGERLFRLVTHNWIDDEAVNCAIAAFSGVFC